MPDRRCRARLPHLAVPAIAILGMLFVPAAGRADPADRLIGDIFGRTMNQLVRPPPPSIPPSLPPPQRDPYRPPDPVPPTRTGRPLPVQDRSGQIAERQLVRSIQKKLRAMGYAIESVDGVYGPNTRNAILAFQRDYGLPEEGEATGSLDYALTVAERRPRAPTAAAGPRLPPAQAADQPARTGPRDLVLRMDRREPSQSGMQALARLVLAQDPAATRQRFLAQPRTAYEFGKAMGHGPELDPSFNAYRGWAARDEFERARVQQEFMANVLEPEIRRAPDLPLRLTLVYPSVNLPEYDMARGGFPFGTQQHRQYRISVDVPGVGNSMTLALDGEWPDLLKMAPPEAQSLVRSLQHRRLYLAADVTLTAVGKDQYGRPEIAGRVTGAGFYADENLTRLVVRLGPPAPPEAPKIAAPDLGHGIPKLEVGIYRGNQPPDPTLGKMLALIRLKAAGGELEPLEAAGFAKAFLPQPLFETYFDPASFGQRNWRGANEFERSRVQARFRDTVIAPLVEKAPSLPLDIVIVYGFMLGPYDPARGGFPLQGMSGSDRDYVERVRLFEMQEATIALPGNRPDLLPIPATRAEALVSSLGDRRAVYLRAAATLTGYHAGVFSGEVRKLAFFADADLTRPIVEIESDVPALPAAMLSAALPQAIAARGPVRFTADTLDLILLRERPELIDQDGWMQWLRQRALEERNLYQTHMQDWFEHDPWGPFFPLAYPQHQVDRDPQAIAGFREWSRARAAGLPEHVVYTYDLAIKAGEPQPLFGKARDGAIRLKLPHHRACTDSVLALPQSAEAISVTLTSDELGGAQANARVLLETKPGAVTVEQGQGTLCTIPAEPLQATITLGDRVLRQVSVGKDAQEKVAEAQAAAAAEEARQRDAAREAAREKLDILGITIGMPMDEAEKIARAHLGANVAVLTEPRLVQGGPLPEQFAPGRLFVNRDTGEMISIHGDVPLRAAIRRISFDPPVPRRALEDMLVGKYGQPTESSQYVIAWQPMLADERKGAWCQAATDPTGWQTASGERTSAVELDERHSLVGLSAQNLPREGCGIALAVQIASPSARTDRVERLTAILADLTPPPAAEEKEEEKPVGLKVKF